MGKRLLNRTFTIDKLTELGELSFGVMQGNSF